MNASATTIENAAAFQELLPPEFIQQTQQRQQSLETSRNETTKSLDQMDINCSMLSTNLDSLGTTFEKKSRAYGRLNEASRSSSKAYGTLGDELKVLSRSMRECVENIRKFSDVTAR